MCALAPFEGFEPGMGTWAAELPGRLEPFMVATGVTIGAGTALGSTGAAGRVVLLVVEVAGGLLRDCLVILKPDY